MEYNDGFGFLNSDFWIGNEKLAYLTNQKRYELNISFGTEEGESYHVTYSNFRISDSFSDYTLVSVGEFTGTLGKSVIFLSLAYHLVKPVAGRETSSKSFWKSFRPLRRSKIITVLMQFCISPPKKSPRKLFRPLSAFSGYGPAACIQSEGFDTV